MSGTTGDSERKGTTIIWNTQIFEQKKSNCKLSDSIINIEEYSEVRECDYKGEHYSVRDNGAIMRHAREGKPTRKGDNIWSFGNKEEKSGYMIFCGSRVHIIVATAFHGANDSTKLVVDHIDTNRCNNRPDNLRWLTRLENALNNPATRKRIAYLCGGDIQKFIDNPSCLRDLTGTNQDVMWMRTVTKEEARNAYERVMSWAATSEDETQSHGGRLGEWIFSNQQSKTLYDPWGNPLNEKKISYPSRELPDVPHVVLKSGIGEDVDYVLSDSLTPNALQGNWRTPTEFLCCPAQITATPLEDYFANLKKDSVFAKTQWGESVILDYAISVDKRHLWVLAEQKGDIKPWKVTEIVMYENCFLHLSRHTYFSETGGHKYFVLEQGKEWDGEDCIDDYC